MLVREPTELPLELARELDKFGVCKKVSVLIIGTTGPRGLDCVDPLSLSSNEPATLPVNQCVTCISTYR